MNYLNENLVAEVPLKHADRVASKAARFNPFKSATFPLLCVNGAGISSCPLADKEEVRLQRYFKYSVTVMDTDIVLDPHFEGHDGF